MSFILEAIGERAVLQAEIEAIRLILAHELERPRGVEAEIERVS